ncbi:MAG TPA: TIGR01244 family sulfur transferase [Geobacterales bacterium]|nr:TIGR01244 family sulfur transferase [Geobacterales bacterium]
MELRRLNGQLAVAGQINPGDVPELAAEGIRAIICNRPDGEAPGQPKYAEIEKAAAANGIKIAYQPVVTTSISDEDAVTFGKLIEELPKPLLVYCRSGLRSTALWALSQSGKLPVEDIVETAAKAGYDIRPFLLHLVR